MTAEQQAEFLQRVSDCAREAVREELRAANIIDGPTHVKHHEVLGRWCDAMDTAGKTLIRTLVASLVGGLILAVVYYCSHGGGR